MKKRLYDNLKKVLIDGQFNDYECFRDLYWLDYKFDGDLNVEEFRDDIIDYTDDLQNSIPYDNEIDDGCYVTFFLNKDSELMVKYESLIDWIDCGGCCGFDEAFKEKFDKIDFKKFVNFNHKNFSRDYFMLDIDIFINFPLSDIRLDTFSLKYKIDDLIIDVLSEDLKEEIVKAIRDSLSENTYTSLYPIYRGEFEIMLNIKNNENVIFKEYYNKHIFKEVPE